MLYSARVCELRLAVAEYDIQLGNEYHMCKICIYVCVDCLNL